MSCFIGNDLVYKFAYSCKKRDKTKPQFINSPFHAGRELLKKLDWPNSYVLQEVSHLVHYNIFTSRPMIIILRNETNKLLFEATCISNTANTLQKGMQLTILFAVTAKLEDMLFTFSMATDPRE